MTTRETHWAPGEWAYPRMEAATAGGTRPGWIAVSERFYWQALEVLPPIYLSGGFAVSEPYRHDGGGRPVFAAFVELSGATGATYWATYCTVRDFPARRAELVARVTAGATAGGPT